MSTDSDLGMDRGITRRDFVRGSAVAIGALGVPGAAFAAGEGGNSGGQGATDYPPLKTGMRGSHPGSFEPAHMLRDGTLSVDNATSTGEIYDCVIVGGGLSGLAAAHYYRKYAGNSSKILIIENHDDFGGHAKRNEFLVDGKLLALNGGTLNMEAPRTHYNLRARELLDDIGIDVGRYEVANESEHGLYERYGLRPGLFFDRETWGSDRLMIRDTVPELSPGFIDATPLSEKAKADLQRLFADTDRDYLPGKTVDEKKHYLATTSLLDYYTKDVGLDPQAMWFFARFGEGVFCVGADANPALFAWVAGLPGFSGLRLGDVPGGLLVDLPGAQHGRQNEAGKTSVHFPDGNATLARLLVGKLIPGSIPSDSQEDMGTAIVNYDMLDRSGHDVRIRLSSIAVNVRHIGDAASAKEAEVTYVRDGRIESVRAGSVIMACWNTVIPHLVPELPAEQQEALSYGTKGPLVYTSIALRNWRAFERLGVSRIEAPSMFNSHVELTEAASLGGLQHATNPNEPIALHLTKIMSAPGLPDKRSQHVAGRARLLGTSFEEFERETRSQLARLLGEGGFDPARDIAGISVNRWPHGYSYTYNSLYDPVEWVFTETADRPCVVGRRPYGLISIANSDAAASPHTDAAFQEAHRAVSEALEVRTYPFARLI